MTVPQGDTGLRVIARPIVPEYASVPTLPPLTQPLTAEATRLDVALMSLAWAQARHRHDGTDETLARLTAAEITYADAERQYLGSLAFTEEDF